MRLNDAEILKVYLRENVRKIREGNMTTVHSDRFITRGIKLLKTNLIMTIRATSGQ